MMLVDSFSSLCATGNSLKVYMFITIETFKASYLTRVELFLENTTIFRLGKRRLRYSGANAANAVKLQAKRR